MLYTGTDDGNLHVSRDGGKDWASVSDACPDLPKGTFVSEVVPSRFDEATVYATFDGHRKNDFETYIYASNDYGQNWRSITANLKGEVARTLTEDQKNPDVLYLGTETGLFVTIDRGRSWQRIKANLPTVRIDEITLHPRDNAMILGTHGRAIWVLDNLVADPGVRGGAVGDRGREAVRAGSSGDVPAAGARPQLRVLGGPDVLRREPAAGGGDLLAAQETGRRGGAADHRRRRQGRAGDLRTGAGELEQGGDSVGVLGPAGAAGARASRRTRR